MSFSSLRNLPSLNSLRACCKRADLPVDGTCNFLEREDGSVITDTSQTVHKLKCIDERLEQLVATLCVTYSQYRSCPATALPEQES